METTINQSAPSYALQKAILLYGKSESCIDLVTIHSITQTKAGATILAGSPASKAGLVKLFGGLGDQLRRPLRLLPPNILASSDDGMVWWEAAGERRIAFSCKELGKRAAVVPHPALLFAVANGKWYVFALSENKRPSGDTRLLTAPYFNVWKAGNICVGTTQVPKKAAAQDSDAWSAAFFKSAFTHPNIHEANELVLYEKGPFAFWRDMLDGKFKSFPTEALVETKFHLRDLIFSIESEASHA